MFFLLARTDKTVAMVATPTRAIIPIAIHQPETGEPLLPATFPVMPGAAGVVGFVTGVVGVVGCTGCATGVVGCVTGTNTGAFGVHVRDCVDVAVLFGSVQVCVCFPSAPHTVHAPHGQDEPEPFVLLPPPPPPPPRDCWKTV